MDLSSVSKERLLQALWNKALIWDSTFKSVPPQMSLFEAQLELEVEQAFEVLYGRRIPVDLSDMSDVDLDEYEEWNPGKSKWVLKQLTGEINGEEIQRSNMDIQS